MPGIVCEHCTAACCRYIALPIDTPTSRSDLDDLRWFLIHQHVSIFVEDGDWYICFDTPCRYLKPDHTCRIYRTRPAICRRYSSDDCDYHSGDYGWQHHFTAPEHLEEYARQYLSSRPARSRTPRANPTRRSAKPRPSPPRPRPVARQCDRAGLPLPPLIPNARPQHPLRQTTPRRARSRPRTHPILMHPY